MFSVAPGSTVVKIVQSITSLSLSCACCLLCHCVLCSMEDQSLDLNQLWQSSGQAKVSLIFDGYLFTQVRRSVGQPVGWPVKGRVVAFWGH